MFSGGISSATLQAFRAYLPSVGVDGTHSDAELEQFLTGASSNFDPAAAAKLLGTGVDAGRATRGSGIHGGAARFTSAISGSKVSQLEIAATAFLMEKLPPEAAANKWKDILGDFVPVKEGR